MHLDADKTYETVLRLGVKTTTADAEGDVVCERPVEVFSGQLEEVLRSFTGAIQQVPPMHSALKKDGKALYEYARAGIHIERAARNVTIFELKVLESLINSAQPAIKLVVKCSKGTYIRTLGEDIGEALGCGAHLSALRRTATGDFSQAQCVSLDALEAMDETQRMDCLLPVDCLIAEHEVVMLDSDNAGRFLSGMRRRGVWPDADQVAVYATAPRALLGTAHVKAGELIPGRLLSPLEISEIQAQPMVALGNLNKLEKVNHEP
jgi:tRNA pseudouridine55 synthase